MSDTILGAEQAVLGACLIDGAAFTKITPQLTPRDFSRPDHRVIFTAISTLASAGKVPDVVAVAAQLEREGRLAEAGGYSYLTHLVRDTPTADNVAMWASYVRDHGRQGNGAAQQLPAKILAFPGISEARIAELAALPTLAYEQRRVQAAKALGIRAKALDEEVGRRRTENTIKFPVVTPWPDPVVTGEVLDLVEDQLTRYVVLPLGASVAIALWIAMVWAFDCFFIAPMLTMLSPQKRCGKTTLLVLLGELCQRSILASNVLGPTFFRVIEQHRPTLLLDELDSFVPQNNELRGIINSGHSKRSAFVLRCVGDNLEPKLFSTWTPKALAAIGRLPATIEDRSVIVRMRRKRPDEKVDLLRQDRLNLDNLRRRLARWSQDNIDALKAADPVMPEGFDGRCADNWRPLLTIADLAGGNWATRARTAAVTLSASSEDDTPAILLLADIRTVFGSVDRIRSADLAEQLAGLECRPWPEWGRARKPITQPQIARLLRPFDIEPRTVRFPTGTARGFLRTQFTDTWMRYLPPIQGDTPTHPQG
jgi:putative DNA primase/helicase